MNLRKNAEKYFLVSNYLFRLTLSYKYVILLYNKTEMEIVVCDGRQREHSAGGRMRERTGEYIPELLF